MTEDEVREILRGEFTIDIPNFEKWNPPTKGKRQWFKMDANWFHDPKFWKLGGIEELLWVKLCAVRARSQHGGCKVDARYLQGLCKVRGTVLARSLAKLLKSQLIEIQIDRKIDRKKDEERISTTPEVLPDALNTPEIREIRERRRLDARALLIWLPTAPSPEWLARKFIQLDVEAPPDSFGEKPFIVRWREFAEKHLGYEKNPRQARAGPRDDFDIVESIRKHETEGT